MSNICTKCHKLKPDNRSSLCRRCVTQAAKPRRVLVIAPRNNAIVAAWKGGTTCAELSKIYGLSVRWIGSVINRTLADEAKKAGVEQYFKAGLWGAEKAADARHGAEGTNIKGEAT